MFVFNRYFKNNNFSLLFLHFKIIYIVLKKFKLIIKVFIMQICKITKHDLRNVVLIFIFFTVLLIISTNNIILQSTDENSKWCSWSNNKALHDYDASKSETVAKYIDFMKELNVTYFLGHGSALGSIRNHGFIPRDKDVDINIPIWLNQHIFHCNQYVKFSSDIHNRKCYLYVRPYVKLCNKHRIDYMKMFKKYAEKITNKKIDYFECKIWGNFKYTSCWTFKENGLYLDLFFLLGTEYTYNEIDICKCHFSGIDTYCLERNPKDMFKSYGRDYLKPKNYSGDCGYSLVTLTQNNSEIITV